MTVSPKILIVEDNSAEADFIEDVLTCLKYNVSAVVSSGENALQTLEASLPDLVLMDINLQGKMDGITTCEQIRERFDVPVIYLTADTDEDTLERAKISVPYGYIIKPFEVRDLRTNIEMALHKHKLERDLKVSQQWFATTLKSIGDAVITTDTQSRITFMNPVAELLTGWTKEEALGENVNRIFQLIHEETRQVVKNPVTIALRDDRTTTPENHAFLITKTGTEIPIDDSGAPIKDEKGHIIGAVLIFHDIIERKKREEELKKAKTEAEAANHAKSEFIANMSHELRTPLNAILGYTQLYSSDSNLTEKQRNALQTVYHSGEHLLGMINDILDLAKIEARRIELNPTAIHLPAFLNHITDMIQFRAKEKGLDFILDIEESSLLERVCVDQQRLRQILLNLLSNAVKFTKKGRILFQVARCEEIVTPSLVHIRFQVQDTGIGIPTGQLEEIFLAFQRIKDMSVQTEGTGLGLTISRQLVRLMGSELHVRSSVGDGSTFWFDLRLLKVVELANIQKTTHHSIINFTGARRTILIVDDNDDNRIILREMLTQWGFDILEASNGHEAINKAVQFQPNLILMDLFMNEMNGFEATQRIRQMSALQDVVVIAISADVSLDMQEKSLSVGCQGFLANPINIDDLMLLLQQHLELEWIYEKSTNICSSERSDPIPIIPPPEHMLSSLA